MPPPISCLSQLLQAIEPILHEGIYVYATLPPGVAAAGLEPIASFHEEEGMTLILEEGQAQQAKLQPLFRASWITLRVHSALQAVGLTAAVATTLAEAGISCNVVAAAFHDHLFVPVESANAAMVALKQLQARNQATV